MAAHVMLPIIIHMLGGLGTLLLAWWLVDEDLRSQAKQGKWEKVLSKAFSDLRRNIWLAKELTTGEIGKVYGRYWIEGLDALCLTLHKKEKELEYQLWSLMHEFNLCNKMLEQGEPERAPEQATALIS